jgi:alpha-amylase
MRGRRLLPAALALAACGSGGAGTGATPPAATPPDARAAVFVHLFEWRWTDIARECEAYLGPAGVTGVQISPPSEHAALAGAPWWERYQTVGYSLANSRGGTEAELRDMVRRCAAVGVDIYADAVINHMTGQSSGTGSDGTAFTKYAYPELYDATDFHMPPCAIAGADYQDAPERVRRCELVGLADLDTSKEHVQDRVAGYLSSLAEAGVRGFRIDAAKHMDPADLQAILGRVSAAARPFYYLEVIDYGGEAIHAADYLPLETSLIEFRYTAVADAFKGAAAATLAGLPALVGDGAGLLPSDRAVVFVNNHDTQRGSSLYYADGAAYDLATVFMLAWPYGRPSLLSSYAFDRATGPGRDAGPPAEAPDCGAGAAAATAKSGWLCEHRRPYVAPLLALRKAAVGQPVTDWWDDGTNQIAFGRGATAFVVINNEPAPLHRTFTTSLAAGRYRDLYGGGPVDVDATGTADITVAPQSAIVLQKDQR